FWVSVRSSSTPSPFTLMEAGRRISKRRIRRRSCSERGEFCRPVIIWRKTSTSFPDPAQAVWRLLSPDYRASLRLQYENREETHRLIAPLAVPSGIFPRACTHLKLRSGRGVLAA